MARFLPAKFHEKEGKNREGSWRGIERWCKDGRRRGKSDWTFKDASTVWYQARSWKVETQGACFSCVVTLRSKEHHCFRWLALKSIETPRMLNLDPIFTRSDWPTAQWIWMVLQMTKRLVRRISTGSQSRTQSTGRWNGLGHGYTGRETRTRQVSSSTLKSE